MVETFRSALRKIERITRRDVLVTVADRWREQYHRRGQWGYVLGGKSQDIHQRLLALDSATAERSDYDAIIGNASWTSIDCDCCGEDVEHAAQFADQYGERTHTLCAGCIAKATSLLSPTSPPSSAVTDSPPPPPQKP